MDHPLALFVLAALVTVASPGPTSLLALNNGARWGVRAALPGIAGAALSDLVLIAAVALGLGALLAATPWAIEALRWAGVGCLGWLGLQSMRSAARSARCTPHAGPPPTAAPWRVMWRSFSVAVSNPKGYLFFLALLPAFIQPQVPALEQYANLALMFAIVDASALFVYASAGALGSARFGRGSGFTWRLDLFSGLALLGMAVALGLWQIA
jgi:threonine/homoserine/homoserine lactone efflux protein